MSDDLTLRFATVRYPVASDRTDSTLESEETPLVTEPKNTTELEEPLTNSSKKNHSAASTVTAYRKHNNYLRNQKNRSSIYQHAAALENRVLTKDTSLSPTTLKSEIDALRELVILEIDANSPTTIPDPLENLAWASFIAATIAEPVDIEIVKESLRLIRLLQINSLTGVAFEIATDKFLHIRPRLPRYALQFQEVDMDSPSGVIESRHNQNVETTKIKNEIHQYQTVIDIIRDAVDRKHQQQVRASERAFKKIDDNSKNEDAVKMEVNIPADVNPAAPTDSPWRLSFNDISQQAQLVKRVLGQEHIDLKNEDADSIIDKLRAALAERIARFGYLTKETQYFVASNGQFAKRFVTKILTVSDQK